MAKSTCTDMTIRLISDEKIAETSSKGNQEKWYDDSLDVWYKLDHFGYEALAETLISMLLEKSNNDSHEHENTPESAQTLSPASIRNVRR